MAADDKVVIGQTHGSDDAEAVLIGYLLGVEALRAGKEVVMWLTKDGTSVATRGVRRTALGSRGAPSIKELHAEYIGRGGRFLRLSGVREDPQPGIGQVGPRCRGKRSALTLRVHRGRRPDVQLLTSEDSC